ncbi:MAG: asparagine synthase C-terminal domain-containing protein [archaeon]
MNEFYINRHGLIDRLEWERRIKQMNYPVPDALAESKLREALQAAVKKRISSKFGILFSGGVDSTLIALICKSLKSDFKCYSVGFCDTGLAKPEDLAYSAEIARGMGLPIATGVVRFAGAERVIRKTAAHLGRELANAVNIGVGSVVVLAHELAKKDGITVLFSGLGSEELFAGYERHRQARDIPKECLAGLLKMWERDLLRDYALSHGLGFSIATPFLDENVIATGMGISANLKLNGQTNKLIVRRVAESLGLPPKYAYRKKRAAQYGSRFDSALGKISKRHGFRFKRDYIQSLFGI